MGFSPQKKARKKSRPILHSFQESIPLGLEIAGVFLNLALLF